MLLRNLKPLQNEPIFYPLIQFNSFCFIHFLTRQTSEQKKRVWHFCFQIDWQIVNNKFKFQIEWFLQLNLLLLFIIYIFSWNLRRMKNETARTCKGRHIHFVQSINQSHYFHIVSLILLIGPGNNLCIKRNSYSWYESNILDMNKLAKKRIRNLFSLLFEIFFFLYIWI